MNSLIQNYLTIASSSAVVYVFIITAIRLFGKKEFAQLSVSDLVFVLLISNAMLEADGNISVLSHDFNKKTLHERKRRKKLIVKN